MPGKTMSERPSSPSWTLQGPNGPKTVLDPEISWAQDLWVLERRRRRRLQLAGSCSAILGKCPDVFFWRSNPETC